VSLDIAVGLLAVADTAVEIFPEHGLSSVRSYNPRSLDEGWVVPHMLIVSTLELRDPLLLWVLTKADNAPLHGT